MFYTVAGRIVSKTSQDQAQQPQPTEQCSKEDDRAKGAMSQPPQQMITLPTAQMQQGKRAPSGLRITSIQTIKPPDPELVKKLEQEKLRAQIQQEIASRARACTFKGYECTVPVLSGRPFCYRHILRDPTAPSRQCTYTYSNGQRCPMPAFDEQRDQTGPALCFEHAHTTLNTRKRSATPLTPATNTETWLNHLTHYVKPESLLLVVSDPREQNKITPQTQILLRSGYFRQADQLVVQVRTAKLLYRTDLRTSEQQNSNVTPQARHTAYTEQEVQLHILKAYASYSKQQDDVAQAQNLHENQGDISGLPPWHSKCKSTEEVEQRQRPTLANIRPVLCGRARDVLDIPLPIPKRRSNTNASNYAVLKTQKQESDSAVDSGKDVEVIEVIDDGPHTDPPVTSTSTTDNSIIAVTTADKRATLMSVIAANTTAPSMTATSMTTTSATTIVPTNTSSSSTTVSVTTPSKTATSVPTTSASTTSAVTTYSTRRSRRPITRTTDAAWASKCFGCSQ